MSYYQDVQNSLLAYCANKAESFDGLKSIKFDAYGNPTLLPEDDLIGPFQFQITDEGQLMYVEAMLLVSTQNDTNLFRMDEIVDSVYADFRPGKTIPVYKADGSGQCGIFTVSEGTSVLPVEQSTGRPMKAVAVSLKLDHFPS
jgi:hypothetical protein